MRGSGGTEQSGDVIRLMTDDQPGIRMPQHPTRHDAPAHSRSVRSQLERLMTSDPHGLANLRPFVGARVKPPVTITSSVSLGFSLSHAGDRSAGRTYRDGTVARGASPYIVQHAGGWKTASMMQRYAHLDPATIRAAVELLALRD